MDTAYLFAAILAGGYIGSRLIFARIQLASETQHLFLMGGEYILIGYVLGPSVLNVLSENVIQALSPIIVVGIGWLGLLLGIQLSLRNLKRFPLQMFQYLLTENLVFLLLIVVLFWLLASLLPNLFQNITNAPFWILVAALSATSPTAVVIMSRMLKIPGRFTHLLRFVCSLEGLIGVVLLGIIYSSIHYQLPVYRWTLTSWHWFIIAVVLGVLGSLFFHFSLRESSSEFETVLVTMGVVIYAGGIAYFLQISALFVSFLIGTIIANISEKQIRISQILAATEKPFYIVFLVFAGALWHLQYWQLFYIAPFLFAVRMLVKWLASWSASRMMHNYRHLPPGFGFGLSSLAGLALAIVIEFHLMKSSNTSAWILGIVILMLLMSQVTVPIILQQILPRLRSE